MNMNKAVLSVVTCVAMVACATSPPTMDIDYDTSADFAALKTYDWMPATGNAATDELLIKRIRGAADSELKAKGRTLDTINPDFLIAMQLSGKTAYGGSTGVGMSVGIPVGKAGRISVGGGKSKPIEKKEGTLVLDFLGAKTKALLWKGTATRTVEPSASPEEQQKRINEVIGQMLSRFPPQ